MFQFKISFWFFLKWSWSVSWFCLTFLVGDVSWSWNLSHYFLFTKYFSVFKWFLVSSQLISDTLLESKKRTRSLTWDVNWTNIKHHGRPWTSYVRSIFVLCSGVEEVGSSTGNEYKSPLKHNALNAKLHQRHSKPYISFFRAWCRNNACCCTLLSLMVHNLIFCIFVTGRLSEHGGHRLAWPKYSTVQFKNIFWITISWSTFL